MKHFPYRRMLALALAVFALALPSLAQESRATLTGRVSDPNGAAVPGATISVTSQLTNLTTTTESNDEGNYAVPALQPCFSTFTV